MNTMPHSSFDFSQLSPIGRIHRVQELWDSIHDDAQAMPLTAEDRAEIDRRHAELESGEAQGVSLDEMRQSLLTRR
jgi:putative addiction module component (TIGR02574 family)